jgi:porin
VLSLPAASSAQAEEGCEEGRPLTDGLCLSGEAAVDVLGNVRGGVRRGVAAIGLIRLGLDADLHAVGGLGGWRFHISAFGIYGRQPAATLTGSLAPPSNIEALPTFRLNEIWLQRDLDGWGSIRFGQLAADSEFTGAEAAGKLISTAFGWPTMLANALPGGGPAYPLAVPGLRLALGDPEAGSGLRFGLFAGDPAGRPGEGTDPQRHNRYGTNFSLAGGALMMAEAVTGGAAPGSGPRSWLAKLGAWYHTAGVDSQRRDATGLSLADPASSGVPWRYGQNYGGYAVGAATLWRGEAGSLGLFARVFAAPSNRNLIATQMDAGLAWRGPFGRADDTLSFGVSLARIGSAARGLDRDRQAFGVERTRRDHETVLEATYDFAVVPGHLSLRPVVQWIGHPAAREPDERASGTRPLKDAFLLGLRMTVTF